MLQPRGKVKQSLCRRGHVLRAPESWGFQNF